MFDDASVLCGGDLLENEDADEDGESDDARHELEQRREHEIVRGDTPEAPADLQCIMEYGQMVCNLAKLSILQDKIKYSQIATH